MVTKAIGKILRGVIPLLIPQMTDGRTYREQAAGAHE